MSADQFHQIAPKADAPAAGTHASIAPGGEAARSHGIAANTPQLRRYMVQLCRAGVVEEQYECCAADSLAAATDAQQRADGRKVKVWGIERYREHCAVEADLAINRKKNSDAWNSQRRDAAWQQEMRDLTRDGRLL